MNREDLLFSIRTLALPAAPDLAAFSAVAAHSHPSDLADALQAITPRKAVALLCALDVRSRGEVFSYFDDTRQDALVAVMPRQSVLDLLGHMPADERADLFNRLQDPARPGLLAGLAEADQRDILSLAAHAEGTVGAATTSEFVALQAEMTVAEALAHIRRHAGAMETIYTLFVLAADRQLLGTLSLRELVVADADTRVGELQRPDPVHVHADWPQAQASEVIRRYDLLAVPVVDDRNRMIGIVTVDDAMDIGKREDATQLTRFGGTGGRGAQDLDVIHTPLPRMFKVRVFWLAVLTAFGIVTSTFVAAQEELLTQAIVLAAFIAPIVDMGGNTGSQSATLVIRGMALGELGLNWRHVGRVIRRELPVAFALGLCIAVLEAVLAWFSKGVGGDVLVVVGLSMLACTVIGGVVGALLPFAARRLGADPATLSAPLLTSVMDLVGVFIYFGFAWTFMGDQLQQAAA